MVLVPTGETKMVVIATDAAIIMCVVRDLESDHRRPVLAG